jgi:hypothetical protein
MDTAFAAGNLAQSEPLPIPSMRTILLLFHVLGLCAGMGTALFLDIYLLRFLYSKPITAQSVSIFEFGSTVVAVGLAILWVSGLGFLMMYWFDSPEKLSNPKVWSKISIVALLTINGYVLHKVIFPRLKARLGKRILADLAVNDALPFLIAGCVSSVSWGTAFCLGMIREFNNVVPAQMILATYLAILFVASITSVFGHLLMTGKNLQTRWTIRAENLRFASFDRAPEQKLVTVRSALPERPESKRKNYN